MPNLDYVQLTGRLGITVGDTPADPDSEPDTIYVNEGIVVITPLSAISKVADAVPPETIVHSVIEASIGPDGFITYDGEPGVWLVDLTSEKINPRIENGATHRLEFRGLMANSIPLTLPSMTARLEAGQVNDFTLVTPIVPGTAVPIVRGQQGIGIADATVTAGDLVLELDDGTPLNAGPLPVGPGGSDEGVASYLSAETSESRLALDQANADLLDDVDSAFRAKQTATFVNKNELGDLADPEDVAGFITEAAVLAELQERELVTGSIEDNPDVLVSVRDPYNVRTWLEAQTSDGGPTPYALALLADGLALEATPTTVTYVADGDSLTADAYGGGTTYPAKLAALLGKTVINQGSGGRRSSEVAIVSGGLAFPIAIPGRTIPAASTNVACTPTLPDSGPNADRTYLVRVQGVACTLTYTQATTSWTIRRTVAAGSATPVPATGAVAIPITAYSGAGFVHILWGGRNSTTDGAPAMIAAAKWMKESGTPFLLVGVPNSTAEPSGNSSYNNIIVLNAALRNAYPREYVEIRGRLISQGLALAGLTADAADTTAISEDRIPPALLADGLHPNEAGRTAIAAIIKDELTIRGLA